MGSGSPFHYNCIPSSWSKKHVTHSIGRHQLEKNLIIIKIVIKSMPVTRRPLDIMTSGLVVIYVGDLWVGLDVLHSNGFEWSRHNGIRCDLL